MIRRTKALAATEAAGRPGPPTPEGPSMSTHVDVPLPDLSRFNQLLGGSLDDSPAGVFLA